MNQNEDLWAKRSIGLKLWSFKSDPYQIAKALKLQSIPIAKGDAHGKKNTYKENQIHILHLMPEDSCWGDSFVELVAELGGVDGVLELIKAIEPANYFFVMNIPTSDTWSGNGNNLSKEVIAMLQRLDTDIAFNFF